MVSALPPGQIGADRDGWEVDGRQVTYGKGPVSHNTEHKNPEHAPTLW
jgi:hypothetical protein